ncbi:hypothetical protein ANN_08251 [Periplaneta americana]|uniref:Uncharacterized protein n=1 Tax=Periplaneta americana TaxID=6978 RepID=A0ABQ8T0W9_PERAM|nr:hypothetical protein ANN_08251 [Periplaneta americana]
MDSELEQRANVKFFEKSATLNHLMLKQAYGNEANLKKRKLPARWVTHCLTAEQKQKHLDISNLLTGSSPKRVVQRETVLRSSGPGQDSSYVSVGFTILITRLRMGSDYQELRQDATSASVGFTNAIQRTWRGEERGRGEEEGEGGRERERRGEERREGEGERGERGGERERERGEEERGGEREKRREREREREEREREERRGEREGEERGEERREGEEKRREEKRREEKRREEKRREEKRREEKRREEKRREEKRREEKRREERLRPCGWRERTLSPSFHPFLAQFCNPDLELGAVSDI